MTGHQGDAAARDGFLLGEVDAARMLGIGVDLLRAWADDGRAPTRRARDGRRFRVSDLLTHLRDQGPAAPDGQDQLW